MDRFFADRWIPCGGCGRDNLMNIALVPEDNEPECFECGRRLV
jgi:hypothetical protein